ncbi:AsmA-like C-terminal region-containing protein [Aureivirga sp. CE67]|uniref:AsmA family protein n=1 Tax=Aureivirga sp. CE67 TaxID=1788983 RepID=UPI001E5AC1C0|nr:AsmA-like C-terminal region-containing protein [Aureivirga sp. CE67]
MFVLIGLLFVLPIIFKSQIIDKVKEEVNKYVNAKVDFKDVDISLIRKFPNAAIGIEELSIINYAPFEGDTLAYVKNIDLKVNLTDLFGGSYNVKSIEVDGVNVLVKTNKDGKSNYDIAVADNASEEAPAETPKESEEESSFSFGVDSYRISDVNVTYIDEVGKMAMYIDNFDHSGNLKYTGDNAKLDTKSSIEAFTFKMDDVAYANKIKFSLDALLNMDLAKMRFTFEENLAHINDLNLSFDGYYQMNEKNQEMDITFASKQSAFKSLLSLVPAAYTSSFDGVKANGKLDLSGNAKGILDDKTIPSFDLIVKTDNASFQYPDLPKGITNIYVNTEIGNKTGNIDDTFVDVKNFQFKIDQDAFKAKAFINHVTTNQTIDATFDGKINLDNLTHAYPVEFDGKLAGILVANISTHFDMNSVMNSKYENIKNEGSASLSNFEFANASVPHPYYIETADLTFNTKEIELKQFKAKTGNSDIELYGKIDNLYAFLFNDAKLIGDFALNSNKLYVNDFLVPSEETEATTETTEENKTEEVAENTTETTPATTGEEMKIPAFLDATFKAKIGEVHYDNIELRQVDGTFVIDDQKADLKGITAKLFGGDIKINGSVDTKPNVPFFDFGLGIKKFDIQKTFGSLEMFQKMMPIANAFDGNYSTAFDLKGKLNKDFSANINSLSGDLLANLFINKVDTEKSEALSLMDQNLNFFDASKLDLKDLKAHVVFNDGKVILKPMNLKWKDVPMKLSGEHGFDQNMDYDLKMDLPAKYLGKDINKLLSTLSAAEQKKMVVPVDVNLSGPVAKPKIKVDLKKAITEVTKKIIEAQAQKVKDEVKDKAEDAVKDLLDGVLNGNKNKDKDNKKDGEKKSDGDKVKDAANDLLDGLFGKKEKK